MNTPLADRLRPQHITEVIGQTHLVGKEGLLRRLIASDHIPSMIFWGPPGVGKTTIARALSQDLQAEFIHISAVTTNLAQIRNVVAQAKETKQQGQRTVLFLDEIHRFNKAQQDALLPHVEDGTLILIGATTENPSFEVNSALLSRSRVFVLKPLNDHELTEVVERGIKELQITIQPDAQTLLKEIANGDARQLLTILEIAANIADKSSISTADITEAAQQKMLKYDQTGDEHYNTISAFIKSMRASQSDAALYYLARMVHAGEDPLFIARRMVIFAAEDIGLAQPTAQVVANSVFDACHKVGYPEAQIILAFGVTYLSQAKKDRSAYDAYFTALKDVETHGNLPIPLNILNAPTKLMKELGYGQGYKKYDQDSYLPEKLKGKKYIKK